MSYDPSDVDFEAPVICADCGRECRVIEVDEGIGSYEYWGFKGVHHDYRPGSHCCGVEVVNGGCKIVRQSVHTARKNHRDGTVKTGDVYRVTVYHSWRRDGPGWFWQEKRVIKRNLIGIPERVSA